MVDAYPLQWPINWPRTTFRKAASFKVDLTKALNDLYDELERLGAANIVVSSSLQTRLDGRPLAKSRIPTDPGVAVYFTLKGKQQCIPCDKWDSVSDNVRAVGLTVAALRGLDRWGAKEMVDAAFSGFQALPAGRESVTNDGWRNVLGVSPQASVDEINKAYRILVKKHHPDYGGDPELFQRLNKAYQDAVASQNNQ